jgi:hypothetical protein
MSGLVDKIGGGGKAVAAAAIVLLMSLALASLWATFTGWVLVSLVEYFAGVEYVEGFWSWIHICVGGVAGLAYAVGSRA